ncbi:MAG: oligosaccharyl transferase, archaeosortase A system-associated [Methanospirillum sp.]|nr:oligosaccharyl transferase, archaeosortase A system-associated [Methanospirillum sp.]
MDSSWIRKYSSYLLLLLVIISALFGLWLRFLPMDDLGSGPVQKLIFMDTWYSMRQIEQITANYPNYAWFDAMTAYPTGKEIDWGPFFPFLCATVCMAFGAVARPENMIIASYIPPLLILLLIPTVWYLGRLVGGEKTAWIAAILIPVISGEMMYRSFYGYLDHHFTETLFSTLFLTLIISLLVWVSTRTERYSSKSIIIAISAGFVYFLGIMNIPTMTLFAGITAIILLIHAVMTRDEKQLFRLFIHVCILSMIFAVLFILFGISQEGFSLAKYTPAHLLIAAALPVETAILYGLSRFLKGRPVWQYIGSVAGIIIAGYLVLLALIPEITNQIGDVFRTFFFFPYAESFINEMQMWGAERAWYSFNLALFTAFIGLILLLWRVIRSYNPAVMASLVWGIIILLSTIMHLRYEYYVAVIIILFTSVTLSSLFELLTDKKPPVLKGRKNAREGEPSLPLNGIFVVGVIIIFIVAFSAQTTFTVAEKQIGLISMDDDWAEALTWLGSNTPGPGVNYLAINRREGFTYPDSAYGVLSWWDYGHWITYISKRIPISSPFQDNVPPVARFLSATTEDEADNAANETRAKYVVTDYATETTKFAALPLWAYGKDGIKTYQETVFQQPSDTGRYEPALVLKQPYFESTAVKLHLFDGSYQEGSGGLLLTVQNTSIGGGAYPVITSAQDISGEQAESLRKNDNQIIGSIQFTRPVTDVEGLGHYRLIYESPTTVAADDTHAIKNVKIFERVAGYTLQGNGTIELPVITNQGRTFVWQQKSANGTFTLPYSTRDNPYEVKATGPYTIRETGKTFDVTEEQAK